MLPFLAILRSKKMMLAVDSSFSTLFSKNEHNSFLLVQSIDQVVALILVILFSLASHLLSIFGDCNVHSRKAYNSDIEIPDLVGNTYSVTFFLCVSENVDISSYSW